MNQPLSNDVSLACTWPCKYHDWSRRRFNSCPLLHVHRKQSLR